MKYHLFIFLVCLCCMTAKAEWQFEVIDGAPQIVPENQICLLNGSVPCMITYDKYGENLYFAYLWNNDWVMEMIDGRFDSGFYSDLRMAENGWPHVVYSQISGTGSKPMYACRDQNGWHVEQISGEKTSVDFIRLAVATDGSIHCVYHDGDDGGALVYARKISGNWTESILDEEGFQPAIGLLNDNHPVVMYSDTTGRLKCAVYSESGWNHGVLLDSVTIYDQPMLEVDPDGLCHVLYHDETSQQLMWMGYDPINQEMQNHAVCQHELISDYAGMTLDRYGKPHIICYYYNILFYTFQNNDGLWIEEELDYGSIGSTIFTSIAVDSSDVVHVTYFSYLMDWYTYAYGTVGNWIIDQIMEHPVFGEVSSLALDSSNSAHTVYFDASNTHLMYSSNRSGKWQSEVITEASQNAPHTLDIELDPANTPFVCYLDANDSNRLNIMYKNSESWVPENIGAQWSATQCDMAIDTNANLYIVFSTFQDHKLILMSKKNGSWNESILDTDVPAACYPRIEISPAGEIHVSYQKSDGLMHLIPGQSPILMTALGPVPTIHDMKTAPDGTTHFAYIDSNTERLYHGRWNGTAWTSEPVTANTTPGGAVALCLDINSTVHVIFTETTSGELIHADNRNGYWELSSITSGVTSGNLETDLVSDKISLLFFNGMPMFAYDRQKQDNHLFCTIDMPGSLYHPGTLCYCDVTISNTANASFFDVPFFFILHIYQNYFFYPAFGDFNYTFLDIVPGDTVIRVIPEFTWPANCGHYEDALVFTTLASPDLKSLTGIPDVFYFGWNE